VTVLFVYWDPSTDPHFCPTCEGWIAAYEKFLEKNDTVNRIQNNYTSQVIVRWIGYYSQEGLNARMDYNVTAPNSLVIVDGKGNFTRIQTDFNETYIKEVIDAYLAELEPPHSPTLPLITVLALSFSFGFFETFSPCLIILLSFVLSYTLGEKKQFKEKFLQVMTFGVGFIFATVFTFLGLATGLIMLSSMQEIHNVLMWSICFFAIILGIHLIGFDVTKFLNIHVETKPLLQKLTRKYVFTYAGLIILGFLFYFLDPCLAPVFVTIMGAFEPTLLLEFLPIILFVFCLGVAIPFIGIGLLAGSISKIVRSTYRHRAKIRAVSGLIIISYALYLIIFVLLKH
jgi:cytochrome c biogenesis protein CcdA